MKTLQDFILFIALITPCMPKVGIAEKVSLYPVEILLILVFPFLINRKFYLKKQLLFFWGCISLSTLFSFSYGPLDIGGAMRCVKGMIYIPLIYIALNSTKFSYRDMGIILIPAAIINVVFYMAQGFSFSSMNIWDSEMLVSGLSRWTYVLSSNRLVIQSGGTHGIWGNYNVLALCAAWLAYMSRRTSKIVFVGSLLAAMVSLSMAVSRESLIVFFCLLLGYFFGNSVRNGRIYISMKAYIFLAVFIASIVWVFMRYGEYFAIFQKLQYTADSINDTGTEENAQLRLGAWYMFFTSLIEYPWAIFTGFGFNLENYSEYLKEVSLMDRNVHFVTLPESFFVEAWAFGGVFCFVSAIQYWRKIYALFKVEVVQTRKLLLKGLFFGLLIANTISGASIISDLLYGQFLIFIGFYLREKREEGLIIR